MQIEERQGSRTIHIDRQVPRPALGDLELDKRGVRAQCLALRFQRLGLGKSDQLLALGLGCRKQQFAVCLATRLLAHRVGLAFRLDLLTLGDHLGLAAFLLGLLNLSLGDGGGVDCLAVLLGVTDVVDLEVDDANAEQRERFSLQALLYGERYVATMGCDLRDVHLSHLALEAVDHKKTRDWRGNRGWS